MIGISNHQITKSLNEKGGLAQLARAPALQAGGHRFESDILHTYACEAELGCARHGGGESIDRGVIGQTNEFDRVREIKGG